MADRAMELRTEDLEQIGKYVQSHIAEWLPPQTVTISTEAVNTLHVEIARVQEEVRANRIVLERHIEFTEKRFEQVDKRFEEMQHNMDKRFEQVDKRFESMDKRFDDLNRNIRNSQWFIGLLVTFVMAASTALQILL